MIDPRSLCLHIPEGLSPRKSDLFERIGKTVGDVCRGTRALSRLPLDVTPIVGCNDGMRPLILEWRETGRPWIYWDRGYARRVFSTWMPQGTDGGYYRWHLNSFQMQRIANVPADRWDALKIPITPWRRNPDGHIVMAVQTETYDALHGTEGWADETLKELALTGRRIVVRRKKSGRLQDDLAGAYCLVSHGSIAAVEAVMCGCPVIVHPDSAAALVGLTDLNEIDNLRYPDREPWLRSLAYCQYNETELVDGTIFECLN